MTGHEMVDCQGAARPLSGEEYVGEEQNFGSEVQFIFVRLSVLREYLRRDLEMPNLPFTYDFEVSLSTFSVRVLTGLQVCTVVAKRCFAQQFLAQQRRNIAHIFSSQNMVFIPLYDPISCLESDRRLGVHVLLRG